MNNNQKQILKEFLKNILNSSANWEGPKALNFASINEQASICYEIVAFDEYQVGHPYDAIENN